MTIGNDAFTIGTAAVAAGGANIIAQKKDVINAVMAPAKDAFVNVAEVAKTKTPYVNFGRNIKVIFVNFKNNIMSCIKGNPLKKAKDKLVFPFFYKGEQYKEWADVVGKQAALDNAAKAKKVMEEVAKTKADILAKESAFATPEAAKYFEKHAASIPGKKGFIKTAKEVVKEAGSKALNKAKSINWKRAGKYAGVAAAIATALVVAKNLLFSSKDDVEEI